MREPDLTGPGTAGWKLKLPISDKPGHQAHLGGWLVKGPFHLAWNHWRLDLCHLREIPGVKSAHKEYPEAEYEFMITSVDPNGSTDPDEPGKIRYLRPIDCIVQFHGCTDEQAVQVLELAARAVVIHGRSPDQDFRRWWKEAIPNTVQHVTTGSHA